MAIQNISVNAFYCIFLHRKTVLLHINHHIFILINNVYNKFQPHYTRIRFPTCIDSKTLIRSTLFENPRIDALNNYYNSYRCIKYVYLSSFFIKKTFIAYFETKKFLSECVSRRLSKNHLFIKPFHPHCTR